MSAVSSGRADRYGTILYNNITHHVVLGGLLGDQEDTSGAPSCAHIPFSPTVRDRTVFHVEGKIC